ncbi:MAG: hypothetical protein D6705_04810 [Deltaproteobacteria bacterium]|nr:MAG: hypothetical protein D6705_04810 [Deltaproteobacteria bacterium]
MPRILAPRVRSFAITLLLTAPLGCGDDGGGTGTDTDATGTDTGTSGSTGTITGTTGTTGPGTTGATGTGTSGSTTGGEGPLVPCDPLAADCGDDVCAGAPQAGFYCRPACPDTAAEGDPCGRAGVCLPSTPGLGSSGELACFELDDCDFLTGDGCDAAAGETCAVVDADPLRTACVPHEPGAAGTPCGPGGILACDPGLGCLGSDLDGNDPGICTGWCDPQAPLPDGCPACIAVTTAIGTCAECSILEDTCPAGEQCQPTNEFAGGACIGFGPGGEGDPCVPQDATMSCQDGLLCLEVVEDVYECVETCDPAVPTCTDPAKTCNDVGLLQPDLPNGKLGLCIEQEEMFCTPGGMPTGCAAGDVCLAVDPNVGVCAASCDPTTGDAACAGNYACLPANDGIPFFDPFAFGNGACGDGCADDNDCPGQARCLLLDGLESPGLCGDPCAPADPNACGASATCVPLPGDPQNGVCMLLGTACDGTDPTSCDPGQTCAAIAGNPAEGTCLPACFEQDPNACALAGGTCQVRTAPEYHDGACVGQATPCDPVGQTGCDAGETCTAVGGGAFGGTAFVCEAAGNVPDGGDCSVDPQACAEGLACVDDVCRAYCDPGNDACAMGTCTDVSADLYLPAGTLGVCI